MKKIIVNNIKIVYILIYILIDLSLIAISLAYNNLNVSMIILSLMITFVISTYIKAILDDLLNFKIRKNLIYGLKNCDFSSYILELEKELNITKPTNKRYYKLKYSLIFANMFQYGQTKKLKQELREFPIEKLDKQELLAYNITLITFLANEKRINEAYSLLNNLRLNYPRANLSNLEQGIILMSDELVNQESNLLKKVHQTKDDYKYNYIGSICNLGTYYYKMKDYEKAYACFKYVNDNSNKTYISKDIKNELKISKSKSSKLSSLYNDININKFGNNHKKYIKSYIRLIILFIIYAIVFHKYYLINKESYIENKTIPTYIENICPINQNKNQLAIATDIKNVYNTDETCQYNISYISFNGKAQYNQIIKYLSYKYNLKVTNKNSRFGKNYITMESNSGLNKYYSKIYIKRNILIYAVARDSEREKIDQIINDLSNL